MSLRCQSNQMKEKMRRREPVFGAVISVQKNIRILGELGLDFLFYDTQHGSWDYKDLQFLASSLKAINSNTVMMWRIPSSDVPRQTASRALDMGSGTICIPDVDTKEELLEIVDACYYPPIGNRSGLAMSDEEMRMYNDAVSMIPMIETQEGLSNLEEIVSLEQVDGIYIGPVDLSLQLGLPCQVSPHVYPPAQKFYNACKKIGDACNKLGKAFGIMASPLVNYDVDLGATMFLINTDVGLIRTGASSTLQQVKARLRAS
jgi:2-keto-3-deoxy-L-rhamnonate aldolase RhmA